MVKSTKVAACTSGDSGKSYVPIYLSVKMDTEKFALAKSVNINRGHNQHMKNALQTPDASDHTFLYN